MSRPASTLVTRAPSRSRAPAHSRPETRLTSRSEQSAAHQDGDVLTDQGKTHFEGAPVLRKSMSLSATV